MKILKTEYIEKSDNSLYIKYHLPVHRTTIKCHTLVYNIIDPVLERLVDSIGIYWLVKFSNGEYMRINEDERIEMLEKEYQKLIRIKKYNKIL